MAQRLSRKVSLLSEHARFLDKERTRLMRKTGFEFTANEIVQILIEQHKLKMELVTDGTPYEVYWARKLMGLDQ